MKYCNRYVVQTIFGDFLLFKTKNTISREELKNSNELIDVLKMFGLSINDVIVSKSITKTSLKELKDFDFQKEPEKEIEYLSFIKK